MIATELYTPSIIIAAGFSGLILACELQRKLQFDEYVVYDRGPDSGGILHLNKRSYHAIGSSSCGNSAAS